MKPLLYNSFPLLQQLLILSRRTLYLPQVLDSAMKHTNSNINIFQF
jgi:hypothetical protein